MTTHPTTGGRRKVYIDVKTPEDAVVDRSTNGGALRPGAAPIYSSPEVLSLLLQYFGVGLLHGGLPSLVYPLFTVYFRMTGAQTNAASALTMIGWNIKMFVAILSDCVPLYGYRRKSWIVLGWALTLICLVVLAAMPHGDPYIKSPDLYHAALTALDESQLNTDAQARGAVIALLCGLGSMCFIVADVASDGVLVEMAQREPDHVRGRLQSLAFVVRNVAMVGSWTIVGVCLNSARFGGSFAWDISINGIFVVFAAPCVALIPLALLFVHEDRHVASTIDLPRYFKQLWQLFQRRAVLQLMAFYFFFQFFVNGWTSTAVPYVQFHWVHVEPLPSQLQAILAGLLYAGGLALAGTWGTHWNWRTVTVVTVAFGVVVTATVDYLTIFAVVRNQWLYLGLPLLVQVPMGVQLMTQSFAIVEVAEVGHEAVTYALLTTVSNLPLSFGPLVANIICGYFKIGDQDVLRDTTQVRNEVAVTYLVYYATTVLGCLFVLLLPAQKSYVHVLLARGGNLPTTAAMAMVLLFACLVVSLVISVLSMVPATACLPIAGGKGCTTDRV
ncbi:Aste57867_19192 [Aphanomyces stellatus]|uniref:Aste57867_19192 protein n=1 Tax=Aphanomyces stellatus TaxID=120398 RepID=A0A485LCA1_9STRA|nr:hypothetical protein As57867_019128 [Aphanomyces stellatus]VFT95914.1 Aste57867_19192 [Aphanomyces stellatus]